MRQFFFYCILTSYRSSDPTNKNVHKVDNIFCSPTGASNGLPKRRFRQNVIEYRK